MSGVTGRKGIVLSLALLFLVPAAALLPPFQNERDAPRNSVQGDAPLAAADPNPTILGSSSPPISIAGDADARPVVIAIIDTGINPYHMEYRATSPSDPNLLAAWGLAEPIPLNISLPETGPVPLSQDADVWASIEQGELYWFPGTRIHGAVSFLPPPGSGPFTTSEQTPIYDDHGHGTGITSECCGATLGTARDPVLIVLEIGSSGIHIDEALDWAEQRPWVDMVSISLGPLLGAGTPPLIGAPAPEILRYTGPAVHTKAIRDSGRPVFVGSGNGQFQGGEVNFFSDYSGPPWVIRVGLGETDGQAGVGPTMPAEILGDGSDRRMPTRDSVDRYETRAGGTSQATPGVAGRAMNLVAAARSLLGNPEADCRCLAMGPTGIVANGPLADGALTVDELLRALLVTAAPLSPWMSGHHDGLYDYSVHPLEFTTYGFVNATSEAEAWKVLEGTSPEPDRSRDDGLYDVYMTIRHAYWDPQVPD